MIEKKDLSDWPRRQSHLGYVESELPFRALPEYDLRAADVALVSKDRWDNVADDDALRGAPEMVVEAPPRSNTTAKIREFAAFWRKSPSY